MRELLKYFHNRAIYVSAGTYGELSEIYKPHIPYAQFLEKILSLTDENNHYMFSLKIHKDNSDGLNHIVFTIVAN